MQSKDDSTNYLIESEHKGLDYILKEIKVTVFQVLYVLRKDEEQEDGMGLFYLQTTLDYLQMHTFPFNQKIYYLWKSNDFLDILMNFVNLFSLSTYLPNISYETLIISVYILLFIILLILLDIFYVSYSFSMNRFKVLWPLYVLRSVTSLIVTVAFLPITETLTSIIQCQNDPDTGKYVIYGYAGVDVECWKGWHIFHALITLVFIVLFVLICAIVAYAFFEPGMNSKDRTARQDSNGELVFIINKVTCQVMFSFFGENESWLLVISTAILAVWLFKVYNFDDPFYDFSVGRFYQIISIYYLWANAMLVLCKVFEYSDFSGGMVAWVIGLPFLVSIMMLTKRSKIDTLVGSQNKFRSGEQIWAHIRYVLQLIQQQEYDTNSFMLLTGYIEKHKETCEFDDCQLKSRNKRKDQRVDIQDQIRGLISELDRMFINGLRKFPRSSTLRVFYALFLLERRHNKNKALEQFELVSLGKPKLYQEFITYRYRKIIKDSQGQSDVDGENDDIVNAIAFNNHLLLCEEMMNLSANLHKEFWVELKEDQPDLARLMSVGARITKATNEAKNNFYRMQKINPNIYQTLKVFSTFMLNVLSDKTTGMELAKQAKTVKDAYKLTMADRKDNINVESQLIPYLYASAKKHESGSILQINTLFTTLLGYQKDEIVGRKINELMPTIYANIHDKCLSNFFNNIVMNLRMDGMIESTYLETDQVQYFKHKNGYIMPLIYRVSINLDNLKYLTTFKTENINRSFVVFIVDKGTQILELSSGAILFFELEIRTIASKKILLNTYIPDVLDKNGRDVVATYVKQGQETQHFFMCSVKDVLLPNQHREDNEIEEQADLVSSGYYIIKLEKIAKSEANLNYLVNKKRTFGSQGSSRNVINVKQSMPTQKKIFSLASPISAESNPRFETNVEIDQQFAVFLQDLYTEPKYDDFKYLLNVNIDTETAPSQDYGQDIHTRRLISNQIVSIDEEQHELFLLKLEEEEQEDSIFSNLNQFEDKDDYKIFSHSNSQELIRKALNTNHQHSKITQFTCYSILWILFIIMITILQYYFSLTYFEAYKSDLYVLRTITTKLVNTNYLTSRTLDLCVIQYHPLNFEEISESINYAVTEIIDFNRIINSNALDEYYPLLDDFVSIRVFEKGFKYSENNLTIETALLFITSLAFNSTLRDNETFSFYSAMMQNSIYNLFNILEVQREQLIQNTYDQVSLDMQQSQSNLTIMLVILIVVTSLAMVKFISLMLGIKVERENILFLFLDIPQSHIQQLLKKCDRFLKTYISIAELKVKNELEAYESSDDDENNHTQEIEIAPDEEDNQFSQQQNRKKIIQKYRKNKLKGNQGIIMQFIFVALGTLTFAIYNIISSSKEQESIQFLMPQFFQSAVIISTYGNYMNAFKLMLLDYEYSVQNTSILEYVENNLNIFTGNQLNLQDFTLQLITQQPDLISTYIKLYNDNLCEIVDPGNSTNCSTIIDGHLLLGIYNAEQYYLEYFRNKLLEFKDNMTPHSELLNDEEFYELDRSLYKYISNATQILTDMELTLMNDSMDSTLNITLILVIIFLCLLVIVFLAVWIPFLSQLNVQINQNIEMLNMIPINVIKDNKIIRRFVKSLIKSMDIEML